MVAELTGTPSRQVPLRLPRSINVQMFCTGSNRTAAWVRLARRSATTIEASGERPSVLSREGLSTNVGPGRPAIRNMSAAGAVRTCGMDTDALDTLELSG